MGKLIFLERENGQHRESHIQIQQIEFWIIEIKRQWELFKKDPCFPHLFQNFKFL